jgi:DHA2 family methylenomycin A resistance protein-like MFS transporter
VVDAYTIAFAALRLAAGTLGDRFGARRVYVSGFVVFVLASLGCGLASGAGALIAARAAQGVGAALMVPCSLALLTMPAAMMARLGRAPSACGRLRQA